VPPEAVAVIEPLLPLLQVFDLSPKTWTGLLFFI
jgi:hypothetical protein